MTSIHITVPASSGNLGPGFDTLGLALNICNEFHISLAEKENCLELISGIEPELHPLCLGMINQAIDHFFSRSGLSQRFIHVQIENHIPIARGLASSATMRLAVLAGLNHLLESHIPDASIVQWGAELEGCTDNVAACYYGGMTASGIINNKFYYYKTEIPSEIDFVAVSPVAFVETDKARTVFTELIKREDAIFTLNRGILLASAIAKGNFDDIGDLFEDKIHQPPRQAKIPALHPLFDVIHAARAEGALGAHLSGSGSTMLAWTRMNKEGIALAMQAVVQQHGMSAEIRFLKADNEGIKIY